VERDTNTQPHMSQLSPVPKIVLYNKVNWRFTASPASKAYSLTDGVGEGVTPMMMSPGSGAEDSGGGYKGTLVFVPP